MEGNRSTSGFFLTGIIVSSLIISPYVLDVTLVSRFITLALFLAITFFMLFRKGDLPLKADLPFTSYLLYTLFGCCSVFWANTSSEAMFESSKQVLGFLVFAFTLFSLKYRSFHFLQKILKFSVVLFFIEFGIGIVQLIELENFDKLSLYAITGINGHKNLLSSFLLLNFFFLILAVARLYKSWKILAGIAIPLNLFAIAFLKTKAVWTGLSMALLTVAVIYACIQLSKKISLRLNVHIALIASIVLLNVFMIKILPVVIGKGLHYNAELQDSPEKKEQTGLDDERLTLWEKSYALFKKQPVAGVGMGNWQISYPHAGLSHLWRAEDLNYTFQRPHNDFLWILSETGLIGFNLFSVFILAIILLLAKTVATAKKSNKPVFESILCLAFIVAYYTTSFFDFPKERIEHTIWINLILGISYFNIRKYMPLQLFYKFRLNRHIYIISGCLLLVITFSGILRYRGEVYTRQMYAAKSQGHYAKVIQYCNAAYSFAFTIDPTSIPLSWYSGNAKAATADYTGAHEDFKEAYRLNPYNRNVLNDLASSYAFSNTIDMAKKYYKEAARISPRFDDPKLNLAAIYIREEDFKMALYWLKTIHHESERRNNYQHIVDMNLRNATAK